MTGMRIRMTELLWILLLAVAGCLGQDCQDGRMGNCNCQSESIKVVIIIIIVIIINIVIVISISLLIIPTSSLSK